MDDQAMALHYGPELPVWEQDWLARLAERCSGVSVLYGPPGCGKTTYLRALMAKLADKFVFYYLPIADFDLLSSPQFVGFWLRQTERHSDKQKVAILEDAESLLAPRSESIRAQVSDLLNVADGFLGDHLKLHIIATTNVPIRELDPAVTRPGRLLGAREFPRLGQEAALRLAEAKGIVGLPVQPDYSLAEIYCHAPNSCHLPHARRFGFA
jgi:SpoVK/Ycf46/Vps4 family AAA+-type ATPase